MKRSLSILSLSLLMSVAMTVHAKALSRDDQLRALSLRNAQAVEVANISLDYLDSKCSQLSDEQVRYYLNSDYHNVLVAVHSLLPSITFANLHHASLPHAKCDTLTPAFTYIKNTLKLQ